MGIPSFIRKKIIKSSIESAFKQQGRFSTTTIILTTPPPPPPNFHYFPLKLH